MFIQITDEKPCNKCQVVKHLSEYYDNPKSPDGHFHECKECYKARIRARRKPRTEEQKEQLKAYRLSPRGKEAEAAYRERRRAELRAYHREWQRQRHGFKPRQPARTGDDLKQHMVRYHRAYALQRKYGITQEEYDRLFKEQNGVCAICGSPPRKTKTTQTLAVDHCHATGNVRGLLCHQCNAAIGFLSDCPELLAKAIHYLQK